MASIIDWVMRGEMGKAKEEEERGQADQKVKRTKGRQSQESREPVDKMAGFTGIRSWGKGSKTQFLGGEV